MPVFLKLLFLEELLRQDYIRLNKIMIIKINYLHETVTGKS